MIKFLGWHPNKFFGDTSTKDNIFNCKLSHLAVLKYARAHDLPYVFIFEDDAYPCIDCNIKLQEYIKEIPLDATIVAMGYCHILPKFNYNSIKYMLINKFNRIISEAHGAHAYIVFKNDFTNLINLIEKNRSIPVDILLFNKYDNKRYLIDNSLFIQHNIKKTMHGKAKDYIFFDKDIFYEKQTTICPSGFMPIEEILKYENEIHN